MDLHQDFLPARLQGADDPGARTAEFALDPGVAAHLAARRVDDDRAAQPRPLVHLHAVLGRRPDGSPRSTRPSGCSRTFRERYPDAVAADARAGGGLPGQPGRLAGHRPLLAVGAGPRGAASATPRTRSCRSTGRARTARSRTASSSTAASPPRAATGPRRSRATRSGASPTPTPSPTWRWRTSSRCATGSRPRCSGARRSCAHALERALAGRYVSRYELVSFTTVPYAEIDGRIRRQDRTVGAVAAGMLAAVGAGALLLRRRR